MELKDKVGTLIKSLEIGRLLKRETVILTIESKEGYSIIPCMSILRAEQIMGDKQGLKFSLYPTSKYTKKKLKEKYGE